MKNTDKATKRTIKDPLIGTKFDERYQIINAIGRGATSSVYRALDTETHKDVALKLLHAHLSSDEAAVARFEREATAAKLLNHPNIVSVEQYSVSEPGIPYLAMEFVDGISLQQLLAQKKWLSLHDAMPIFAQICNALAAAHQKQIVHRDLKPGNIMLKSQSDGSYFVKVLDFGCAQMVPALGDTVLKVTQTGEMLGSLLYMSPEQCLDQDVDSRSDCYSAGCILYEMLTGKPPLAARTAFETMNLQMTTMPESLNHVRADVSYPNELQEVLFKAMAKKPAQRYKKITDFADALKHVQSNPKSKNLHTMLGTDANSVLDSKTYAKVLERKSKGILAASNKTDLISQRFSERQKLVTLKIAMLALLSAGMATHPLLFIPYLMMLGVLAFTLIRSIKDAKSARVTQIVETKQDSITIFGVPFYSSETTVVTQKTTGKEKEMVPSDRRKRSIDRQSKKTNDGRIADRARN